MHLSGGDGDGLIYLLRPQGSVTSGLKRLTHQQPPRHHAPVSDMGQSHEGILRFEQIQLQSRIWGNPMKACSGSRSYSYGKKELPLIHCPDCNDDATTCDLFMGEEYRNYLRLHRDLEC
ncbi:hypothetical protein EJB05_14742, partial [Eragrostis curvula]